MKKNESSVKKKHLLFIFISIVCYSLAYGDDVIVLTNSEQIQSKILEIRDKEIKYKRSDMLDGPTFVTSISEITKIIFDNGIVQYYNEQPNQVPVMSTLVNTTTSHETINHTEPLPTQREGKTWRFEPTNKRNIGFTFGWTTKQKKEEANKSSFLAEEDNKLSHGLNIGFIANPVIKYGLGIRTGFKFEFFSEKYKDYTENWYQNEQEITAKSHDFAFSLPLQLSFQMEVAKNFSLLLYTGPVFDFEILKVDIKDGERETDNYKDDEEDSKWNGFNPLWGIGGGIQYKFIRLDIGGEFGLTIKDDEKWNKPIYLGLSFLF